MKYKNIFTALTHTDDTLSELSYAVAMTAAQDAHLKVLCLGIDHTPTTYYEIGSNAPVMQAAMEEAHHTAARIQTYVETVIPAEGIRWECLGSVVHAGGVGHAVASEARFVDLTIVALPCAAGHSPDARLVFEGLLFETDCPCIVVPPEHTSSRLDNIVIAWNESKEAMRAARAALPLLKSAKSVHIAVVDPSQTGPERSDPGGSLAVFLSRHDVRCDIQVMSRQGLSVSERLAHYVLETGSDMLVMGGYGHSRLREALLGGTTRHMLEHSKVPVLMAH